MPGKQATSALVIGAGVVGLSCALRLQRQGLRTVLVDPCDGTAASLANAGHIAVEQVEPLASWRAIRSAPRRWFRFGGALDVRDPKTTAPWIARFVRASSPARFRRGCDALRGLLQVSLPAWQRLVADLARPDLLAQQGHLIVWESAKGAARGRAAWQAADIGTARVRDLEPDELEALARSVRPRLIGGLRFEGTGQIVDLPQTLAALREAFVRTGGRFVRDRVRTLELRDGRAHALLHDGETSSGDVVLIAAGVRSAELMAALGPRPPLIAERGYYVQWSDHAWPSELPPVVFEERSMIVTRFLDGLRVAGFVEFARAESSPDPRKWATLRAHAGALGLPTQGEGREWIAARPTLPDYLPAIGRSAVASNLYYAFGHQHLGLTLAPITAEAMLALVVGATPPVPLAPFDLQRFRT